mmetsp:Transcript_37599/g.116148  ORF Transcript_37599/g.116148 Transcript_37599/m.116148 type:complete len:237 (-) Transcript_37599:212-922(-)
MRSPGPARMRPDRIEYVHPCRSRALFRRHRRAAACHRADDGDVVRPRVHELLAAHGRRVRYRLRRDAADAPRWRVPVALAHRRTGGARRRRRGLRDCGSQRHRRDARAASDRRAVAVRRPRRVRRRLRRHRGRPRAEAGSAGRRGRDVVQASSQGGGCVRRPSDGPRSRGARHFGTECELQSRRKAAVAASRARLRRAGHRFRLSNERERERRRELRRASRGRDGRRVFRLFVTGV